MGELLKDRVALITGSSQGIGKAIALEMAGEGAKVITNNRKPGAEGGDAETTASAIKDGGGQAIPVYGDVASFDEAQRLVQEAVDNFGRIDILVTCAGTDAPRMIWNMTENEWDRCLDSYLKGTFNCVRHACGFMRQQRWGRIILMTSEAFLGTVGHANYGAAKGGIVGFARSVAREMGRYNVTCNALAPEAGTRFTLAPAVVEGFKKRHEAGLITKERLDELLGVPPPEYLSPFVVYLASEPAANINGQVFRAAGGEITLYSEPVRMKSIFKGEGKWTQAELAEVIPKTLAAGLVNPAPPESPSSG
ncbi:MAG TPA: 3-hydroxyacyl-CoA dehydrogenase [Dehalococcoidia bacterium]|nr:3-hydroxyacyl-CoA dehydrogenase [Dehalococcoidia bacterium]